MSDSEYFEPIMVSKSAFELFLNAGDQKPSEKLIRLLREERERMTLNGKWRCQCATCQQVMTDKDGPRPDCLVASRPSRLGR